MGDALLAEVARRGVGTARSFRVDAPAPRALIFVDDSGERTILGFDRDLAERVYPLADVPRVEGVGGVTSRCTADSRPRWPSGTDALQVVGHRRRRRTAGRRGRRVGGALPGQWATTPRRPAGAVAGPRLRWVVVTRGARGANTFGLGTRCHVAGRPATQVDATGAGDAFARRPDVGPAARPGHQAAMTVAAELGAAAVEVLASIPVEAIEALCWDLT